MLTTDQIRESFLEFFKKRGHAVVPSDSLVPQDDPTLLFTGAGMNQFKNYFLGLKKDLKRAASVQKCLRTGDLDEVGRTDFHHSFFEMLGNFSFGDYFKEEAIRWAWEYFTVTLRMPADRLRVSVHRDDEEALKIWKDKIKIRPDWIFKLGDKDNFWPSDARKNGPNGPCGPCSEIYFDRNPSSGGGGNLQDEYDMAEGDRRILRKRFAEIWNLVFTQYDRQEGGKLIPLAQKNIDTGMGLERLACVLQGKKTNYEIDIFQPINKKIESLLLRGGEIAGPNRVHLYALSDHLRAVTFSMADGVIPSNEGRGYVIRKLIRRALWRSHQIKPMQELEPFLYAVVPIVASVMSRPYPALQEAAVSIASTIRGEEERFLDTFETGNKLLMSKLSALKTKTLPGEIVFELYDTYGFPDELTKMIAEERGFQIDMSGFDKLMGDQRKRAKDASQIPGNIFVSSDLEKSISALPATRFLGYDALEAKGKVLWAEIKGDSGIAILDQTPFYAESGGQVGDQGIFENKTFRGRVTDTQRKDKYFLHTLEIEKGSLQSGDEVNARVDKGRRDRIMRNHTATHLLHAALRKLLGNQVRQLGSLVAPEKLRFDYSYSQPLTEEQMKQIEDLVNAEILKDTALLKEEKAIEEAKKDGAIAFFGEKYGKTVRVVTVPDFSKEFCGGTHCERTGQIGAFVMVGDSSIASGTRRIEALTGEGALDYTRTLRRQVNRMAESLKTPTDQLEGRIAKLQESVKRLERQKNEGATGRVDPKKILEGAKKAGPFLFAAHREKDLDLGELRGLSDRLRSMSSKTIYFLGTENGDKIHFLIGMSPDLGKTKLDARELGKELTPFLKANSGGRADLVQGGASNEGQLVTEWEKISDKVIHYLQAKG